MLIVTKYSLAFILFAIAAWLLVEYFRLPPSQDHLSYTKDTLLSVNLEAELDSYDRSVGEQADIVLQDAGTFTFHDDQPGFSALDSLRRGDVIEVWSDDWPLPHPRSFEVYALTVNGEAIATYEQTLEETHRAGYAFTAAIFGVLGKLALSITGWGNDKQARRYRKLRFLHSLLGR